MKSAEKLDLVETLGFGVPSNGGSGSKRERRSRFNSNSNSNSDSNDDRMLSSDDSTVSEDELLQNAECVWDGGGNGDPLYYIQLCTSYSEAECISSRNGFLDGRCVWLGGRHEDEHEEEENRNSLSRRAPSPKDRRAPLSRSKRSRRGPRPMTLNSKQEKERMAAVLNFESVQTVDARPFTMDFRTSLALCALIVLMALAVHRLCRHCFDRMKTTHFDGGKTRDDDGDYTLLV